MIHRSTFPETYAELKRDLLLDAFESGPGRMTQVTSGLSPDELLARPIEGKWSIQEIAFHVTDSELMGAARMRQTLTQSDRTFAAYDQDEWALGLAYLDRTPAELRTALELLGALRKSLLPLLRKASETDWDRSGRHAEFGDVTLRQLLELYADHTERHVEQILERRRLLGRSMTLASLLPIRLY